MDTAAYGTAEDRAREARDARDHLLDDAARLGFALASYPTPQGQVVWEWRRGDRARPQFLTERSARQWMAEWIERTATARAETVARTRPARGTTGAS